jgi:hypothetical protein
MSGGENQINSNSACIACGSLVLRHVDYTRRLHGSASFNAPKNNLYWEVIFGQASSCFFETNVILLESNRLLIGKLKKR